MAEANFATLTGLYREIYADLVNAVPKGGAILKLVPYLKEDKIGDSFHVPVVLSSEQGMTYGGTTGDAFALETPIGMNVRDAVVNGYRYTMQSMISDTAISRALAKGRQAAAGAVATVVTNAMESSAKRLGISVYYGQSGLGDVTDTSSSIETTSTTATLVFSAATWAAGIWAGQEGAAVQFYDLDNDALISSGADAVFTVTSVNNGARTIVFTGTATGIDALDVAVQAGGVRAYFKGSKTNDMLGLYSILQNTGSMFGISAADFGLWRGNTFAAGGALTHTKLQDYVGELVSRGLDADVKVVVNPRVWSSLNADEAANRIYDSSYNKNKANNGFGTIAFQGQNGVIEIVSDYTVKQGHAFIFPADHLKRIGSVENENRLPSVDATVFYTVQGYDGVGFRVRSDQAVYCDRPAIAGVVTDITL